MYFLSNPYASPFDDLFYPHPRMMILASPTRRQRRSNCAPQCGQKQNTKHATSTANDIHHPLELFARHLLSIQKNQVVSYNVSEDEKGYSLLIEVPGVHAEDMTLKIDEGEKNGKRHTLVLTGVRKVKNSIDNESMEELNFMRRFVIGDDVDLDRLSAHLEDGVLNVRAPKKEPEPPKGPRLIKIVSADVADKTATVDDSSHLPSDHVAPSETVTATKEDGNVTKNDEDDGVLVENEEPSNTTVDMDTGKASVAGTADDADTKTSDSSVAESTEAASNDKKKGESTENNDVDNEEDAEEEEEIVFEKIEAETCESDDEA